MGRRYSDRYLYTSSWRLISNVKHGVRVPVQEIVLCYGYGSVSRKFHPQTSTLYLLLCRWRKAKWILLTFPRKGTTSRR